MDRITNIKTFQVGTVAQGGEQLKREKDTANKSSTDLAKTPRTLSAFYSKMCVLASGSTSPKYAGMKVVSLMDSNSSHQDFALKVVFSPYHGT